MNIESRIMAMSDRVREVTPGVLVAFTIAAASMFLAGHYGAPVMLFALLIGMVLHFLSVEGKCTEGIQFTASKLLRIGVALLGVRVSFGELASLGAGPPLLTPVLIGATILSGLVFARLFRRDREFGILTGGAVAICGASAALAIASVLPRTEASERNTLFTVIAVTTLSTVAMILYPVLFSALGFDDREIGYLIGATIHDVAQVVGAGYGVSDDAGAIATYVKMMRVAMLPVVVIALSFAVRSEKQNAVANFPWFAIAFAVILALNSFSVFPPFMVTIMTELSRWFLVAAIAALGMKTSLKAMADLGGGHIGVVVMETLFLLALALAVVVII